MQFLHKEDTEPTVKKLDGHSPGRLVIPQYNRQSWTIEDKEPSPPPKVEKRQPEEWVTQIVTQEEVRSEPPLQTSKLSADKMHFLHKEDTEPTVKKLNGHSPGRLVIPQYNRQSWTIEDKEPSPPPKVEKRQPEEWVTQIVTQEEVRSEPPLQTSKLSADKMQFLHKEDTEPTVKKLNGHSPGRLVIPQYNRQSWTIEDKEPSPPPKVEKRQPEEWVTQIVTQEEVRSEPPLQANRLSADKMQFLHKEDTEPTVKKLDGHSPGRLVIPQYNRQSWTIEDKEPSPPPKVEKRQPEEWVTQIVTQEEVRSEPPLQTSKLSADKMHFLNKEDTEPVKKLDGYSPGKLVIPEFNQYSSTIEVKDSSPPPKVEKWKTDEWVTLVATKEDVRSEPPRSKQAEETEPSVKKLDGHSPGRLVIPEYNRQSWTIEDKEPSPPPKIVTQEEVRSEPPLQTNKLSADKMQFLHKEDAELDKKVYGSSPGRLVIPQFNQVATAPRSEVPLARNKLQTEKVQFLHTQDSPVQPAKPVNVISPGRIVIPSFNQHNSTFIFTVQVKESTAPKKVMKGDGWIRHTTSHEDVRSDLLPTRNRLSADQMQFVHMQDTEQVEKLDGLLPGRLVIPEYNRQSWIIEDKEPSPPPKVEKRKPEEWVIQVEVQEEVRSEPPPTRNRLSADQMQFVHMQDTGQVEKLDGYSPGRLVIPEYNQYSSTIEVNEPSPPPKVEKRKPEEWVIQVEVQEEVRSEPPPTRNRLPADKMQFVHTQENQTLDSSSPGRIVIPDFSQRSSKLVTEESAPNVEKQKGDQWIIHSTKQEDLRSVVPPATTTVSGDHKFQFLRTQDQQPTNIRSGSLPGRLVIPDYNQHSSTTRVNEVIPAGKVDKRNADLWITQTTKREETRSELPRSIERLSEDKVKVLHTHNLQPVTTLDRSSPGKIVIPDFNRQSFSVEVQGISPSQKVDKRSNSGQWSMRTSTQEVLRSGQPPPREIESAEKVQFSHAQIRQGIETLDTVSLGTIVIPDDSNQRSFSINVQERSPSSPDTRNAQQWITQTTTNGELQSNKLPHAGRLQFDYTNDTQPAKTVVGAIPGRMIIADFNQDSSSMQVQEVVPPPTMKKTRY
ncbi:hypothetical protein OS493_008623 [Desmophyllum pertusum]|uniref:Uncharacterized protein n=1 Tax=Desmophyllum pertusum TaxID=174260 RepID=A0A9X0D6B4_9CNID|nr:hypothetical protein OS493_008623 [Desmophyllum pertusum]